MTLTPAQKIDRVAMAMQRAVRSTTIRKHCLHQLIAPLLLGASLPAHAGLPTLVSTNLCADQAVLSLALPEQILSVSIKSHDARYAPHAEQARRYPANYASTEEVLYWRPDIVVASHSWAGNRHRRLLEREGIRTLTPTYPRTLQDILEATEALASELGRAQAGARLVNSLRARIRDLPQRPLNAVYIRPNGGSAGRDTYVDEVFRVLGFSNLPAARGIGGWGRYPLEYLVQQPPDLFVLNFFQQRRSLKQSLYSHHPVLQRMLEALPHIDVPSTYWSCGGWQLVIAAETVADRLDALGNELEK